jgi:glycosyltransferase involved in cell wall biosynthesis
LKILVDDYLGHITLDRMLPYLKLNGHIITKDLYDNPDVYLSSVRIRNNIKIPKILRLDSIYYNTDVNYKGMNDEILKSRLITNGIIYQSNYSRMLINDILGNVKCKDIVIYNGIEKNWCGKFEEHDGINITVTGKHRRHKRLKEIVELFLEYNIKYPNSTLHIFGSLNDNKIIKHAKIKYYGFVKRKDMYDVLRITDFTLHLSKRDSCPNSVVEYIGAGIPVITTNNCGGTTEICKLTKGCTIVDGDGDYNDTSPVPHYGEKWNVLPLQVKNDLLEAMYEMTENKRRVDVPDDILISNVTDKYINFMREFI